MKDLKLLVRDYPVSPFLLLWYPFAPELTAIFWQRIAQNALTILINLSSDEEVLGNLAEDDTFLETVLKKITVRKIVFFLARSICCIDLTIRWPLRTKRAKRLFMIVLIFRAWLSQSLLRRACVYRLSSTTLES